MWQQDGSKFTFRTECGTAVVIERQGRQWKAGFGQPLATGQTGYEALTNLAASAADAELRKVARSAAESWLVVRA